MAVPQVQISVPLKGTGTAYLLWFFLGGLGVHKFYLGRPGLGILYALTLGLLGLGLLWDLFTIPGQVRDSNRKLVADAREISGEQSSSNWRSLPDEPDAASPLSDPDQIVAKYLKGGQSRPPPSVAAPGMAIAAASRPTAAGRASFGKKRPA
jgi:hypothetical protein